jgi:hypothetical protein
MMMMASVMVEEGCHHIIVWRKGEEIEIGVIYPASQSKKIR